MPVGVLVTWPLPLMVTVSWWLVSVTVMVASAVAVGSAWLVAVRVQVPGVVGAV